MKPNAIQQAEQRLISAQEALDAFKGAETKPDIAAARRHWSSFLAEGAGVFTKLEQGAKCCGKCAAWFGRVKNLRKKDQLLSYLHHARDADTHGLDEVTVHAPQGLSIKTGGAFGLGEAGIDFSFKNQDDAAPQPVKITVMDGSGVERDVTSQVVQQHTDHRLVLVKVTDGRFGDSFNPPAIHLQSPLNDAAPAAVGSLAIDYLRSLIDEAKTITCA
jgi:hypothetical protein